MFAARFVGAGKTGFGSAFIAVIVQAIFSAVTDQYFASPAIGILVAVLAGSAIYAWILETTLIKGFLIGLVSTVIAVAVILVFGGMLTLGGNVA